MNQFSQELGKALSQSIGLVFVKVLLIFILVMFIVSVLGLFTFGLAIYFYKRKKPKAFLISGLLSTLFISLIGAIILSSKLTNSLSLFIPLAPTLFIIGIILVVRQYQKLILYKL